MLARSWTEINLGQIQKNYEIYAGGMPGGQKVMAVVKADAYGHGDTKVALALQKIGCEDFAVSNIEEAKKLRLAGVMGQVLILGYTPVERVEDLITHDLTQTLISADYARELHLKAELKGLDAKNIKTQFAIDTGMNRIGLDGDDQVACAGIIREYADRLDMTGIFTHLCVADTPDEHAFTDGQIIKFKNVASRIEDLNLKYIHCNNTAAGLWNNKFGNLTRLGISLYGLKPDYENTLPHGIEPALVWKSVVSMVKDLNPGETVGYGRTYKIDRPRRIATIPTGYADGYSRHLSNVGSVVIRTRKPQQPGDQEGQQPGDQEGQQPEIFRAQVAGRICMDQFMIDVTNVPEIQAGDEVELIGEDYTADEMAHAIHTIGYEIVCAISPRVARTYIE